MGKYIELIKQGQRSLKYELSRLIALVTIYGKDLVVSACTDCLKSGIIGVDSLELHLRSLHHPDQTELQPEPIQFEKEKLNRVYPTVDLRKYDALLFEVDNQRSASEDNNNGDVQSSSRGAKQSQVEALGPGLERGLSENDAARTGPDLQTPEELDQQGESRKKESDDPVKNQKCEIPQVTDN